MVLIWRLVFFQWSGVRPLDLLMFSSLDARRIMSRESRELLPVHITSRSKNVNLRLRVEYKREFTGEIGGEMVSIVGTAPDGDRQECLLVKKCSPLGRGLVIGETYNFKNGYPTVRNKKFSSSTGKFGAIVLIAVCGFVY